jgi:LacI family transcriptional regulator
MVRQLINLKGIAERANVSITTVSRVLRGRGEISEDTRDKVLKIAEKMRYRPNLAAKSIVSGQTNTVGVVMPSINPSLGNFDIQIALGIYEELSTKGIIPITLWTHFENKTCEKKQNKKLMDQILQLIDRRVDGMIVMPIDSFKDMYVNEIVERNVPLVTVDRDCLDSCADFVGTDDAEGARLAARHLLELGHRRLGHIAGSANLTTGRVRWESFKETIAKIAGTSCIKIEDETFGTKIEPAMEMLKTKDRPTAIFAANDMIAFNVYKAAKILGLKIGIDISVVGFADLYIAEMLEPSLTTIKQDPYEMGKQAARMLLERVGRQVEIKPRTVLLKPELIIRNSTQKL